MGAVRVSIVTITYDTRSVDAFWERLNNAHTSQTVKRRVAEGMLAATIASFIGEHSPAGVAWTPLAAATVRARRGRAVILRDTGAMFSTLRPLLIGGDPSVEAGAGLPDPRARVHQEGNARTPRRAYFPTNGQASDAWWQKVTQPIRDAWRATR
jgi:hypothetical protein